MLNYPPHSRMKNIFLPLAVEKLVITSVFARKLCFIISFSRLITSFYLYIPKRAFLSSERNALFFSVRVRQNSQTTDFVSFANDFSIENSQTADFVSF